MDDLTRERYPGLTRAELRRERQGRNTMRRGPTRHLPTEDPADPGWCTVCNLPVRNAIHDLPQRTDEQRNHEDRRMGERS